MLPGLDVRTITWIFLSKKKLINSFPIPLDPPVITTVMFLIYLYNLLTKKMNKITLLKIALLFSVVSFAQNIDTTKYQKVNPAQGNDTIKNYYNPNINGVSNDTIKEFYPAEPAQDQPVQNTPPRNSPIAKPIREESP